MIGNIISIFIGGGLGAVARYLLTVTCRKYLGLAVLGTFSANMLGCLLIGFIFGITMQKLNLFPNSIRLFITVGFLGGLTTFSTLNLEIFEYLQNGKYISGMCYLFSSCILGLIITSFGYYISKSI